MFVALPAASPSFGELTGFADGAPKQPMMPVDKVRSNTASRTGRGVSRPPSEDWLPLRHQDGSTQLWLAPQSFKLHVGGVISLPTKTMDRPKYDQLAAQDAPPQAGVRDPFEGLPFRNFAERWGERIMPVVEHARDTQRGMDRSSLAAAAVAVPQAPDVPHILPFTRW